MTSLIDISASILSQNSFCFDTDKVVAQFKDAYANARFGILNFAAISTTETNEVIDLLFTVDCSGSMADLCSDNRSKMDHIIHTLKNMILFLIELSNVNINIIVNAFDTEIYKIIEKTRISKENCNEMLEKIDKINPRGSTNIEFALSEVSKQIQHLKSENPSHIVSHIFMTDGEATRGSKNIDTLRNLVVDDIINAFIGFGIDHDAALLNGVCSSEKCNYYFIDKIENSGLVYGEILHSIVYRVIIDAEIHIENGLVYDFRKNEWVDTLKIGDIISESNKTFNVMSSNPELFKAQIKGKFGDLLILFPATRKEDCNLSIHSYRLRTMQLLYDVNEYYRKCRKEYNSYQLLNSKTEKDNLERALRECLDDMKKFISDESLSLNELDEKFMKNLCDDIYISLRTFNTYYGNMFCSARLISQGYQRVYTVTNTFQDIMDEMDSLPVLGQDLGLDLRDINYNLALDFHHEVSDFTASPYLNSQATQVMRYISGHSTTSVSSSSSVTREF